VNMHPILQENNIYIIENHRSLVFLAKNGDFFWKSTQKDSLPSTCHFKTEPTETVALCFGYTKTLCLQAEGNLSSSVDEQHIRV
jgi:hypothetical protein